MKADGNTHVGCTREMFRDEFQVVFQILHSEYKGEYARERVNLHELSKKNMYLYCIWNGLSSGDEWESKPLPLSSLYNTGLDRTGDWNWEDWDWADWDWDWDWDSDRELSGGLSDKISPGLG
jgi:hypothetical protein